MTFLGSVPFLLLLLASLRDIGAVDDEAEGAAAASAAAGDMDSSGLLGGETVRPHPNRPLKKPAVAERLRDDDLGTAAAAAVAGGPVVLLCWAGSSSSPPPPLMVATG